MNDEEIISPPKLADRYFSWYCRNELRESIQGDMWERYEDYRSRFGKKKSDIKYWLDVFRFMNRHTLKRKTQNRNYLIPSVMLKNYTIVAFRNIKRNMTFTAINVIGLSISMAVCLLLLVMVDDQTSYDEFQSKREDIYRVTHQRLNGVDLAIATTPLVLGDKVKSEFSGVSTWVQFSRGFSGEIMDNGKAINIDGIYTNPKVFDLFDFPLEQGDPKTALSEPNTVVLKKEIADKFFKDQDPIGQILNIENLGQYEVTGVLKELPGKTHIQFEAFASFATLVSKDSQKEGTNKLNDWENLSGGWNYFMLENNEKLKDLEVYLEGLAKANYNENTEYIVDFNIQKMTNITPGPLMGNQIGQSMPNFFVYGLVILAILIMTCAAFNYANLTTARALTRFKEVGVRKVMGSTKGQVIAQFIIEAILVSLFSLVIAIGFLEMLIPAFEQLSMSSLLNWELDPDTGIYFQFLLFSLLTGLFTGLFPSLYMSSVKPINALKGAVTTKMSKLGLKKSLIVTQLVISIFLIISSTLVYRQIKFMIEKDYGYEREGIVNIDLQGQDFELLKPELEKLPFVSMVSGATNIPNTGSHDDVEYRKLISDEVEKAYYFGVDENYISNLELSLVAGRNFTPDQLVEKEIIINQRAVESFRFASEEEAIGQNLILEDSTEVNIVGVVEDYNFMIVYMEIEPLLLRYVPKDFQWAQVKVNSQDRMVEIKSLEEVWAGFDPNHDFEYKYFDEQVEEFHALFYDLVYIIGLISILSMVIAGMGLLGIATYSIQTRLKEVGIRKILGANGKSLMFLLGKSFFMMILFATLIGSLLSFFGNKVWLDLFAYRISFGLDIIAISFLFIAVIGGLTIGSQTLKAMRTNPADILRNE